MKIKGIFSKIFISFIILIILLLTIMPSSSAGFMDDWYRCEPIIDVEWNETDISEPISPYSEPREIPIKIKIKISGPLQHIVSEKYGGNDFFVDLYMEDTPEWCKASLYPPIIIMKVSQNWEIANATIAITLDKDSPAFQREELKIRIVSRRMGYKATVVPEGNATLTIPFKVGYVPYLAINELGGNHKEIEPNEVAYFPLEVINLGNDITDVKIDLITVPDGWNVEVFDFITLDKYHGKSYKKTLNLAVKPPDSFGYHEDREVIEVSITPSSNFDSNLTGESNILTFVVYSRGFSTPGFEGITVIISLFVVLFIYKRKKLNNYKKEESN